MTSLKIVTYNYYYFLNKKNSNILRYKYNLKFIKILNKKFYHFLLYIK